MATVHGPPAIYERGQGLGYILAGLVSGGGGGGPNTNAAQWTVQGDHNLGGWGTVLHAYYFNSNKCNNVHSLSFCRYPNIY